MQTRRKRVLHLIDSGGVYGAERVILNLSQQLKNSTDFTPIVGCIVRAHDSQNALYDAAQNRGIEAIRIPIKNSHLLIDILKAAIQLEESKIDLIHSHGYKPSVFGFVIRLQKNIPVMSTCHLWFEPSKAPWKMRVLISLERYFYRWFPKVVAVSEPIRQTLLSCGLDPQRIEIVQNGVDVPAHEFSSLEITALRQQLRLRESSFCVLNTARLTRQKAQWVLVEAAAQLKSRGHNVHILIVGEGPLSGELKVRVTEYGLERNVSLLGFREDVNKLLALSDAFALPSIDEGMPMSLLEAAAAKIPIISTLVGDIGKLIVNEKTGLTIPLDDPTALADAIARLMASPEFAQELAQRAHQKMMASYSSAAMSNRYQDIYRQILGVCARST